MDRCPHCGKSLRPEAESCPHCGSDFETGWNPDADYYSLELPVEEETFPPDEVPGTTPWETIIGIGVVGIAGVGFLAATFPMSPLDTTPWETIIGDLVMATLLLASLWFFLVKTRTQGRARLPE